MKKRIAAVLKEMMKKTSPDKITVSRLVEECGISRSLFYYYFEDVFDVMAYHLEMDIENAITEALKEDSPEKSLVMFLESVMSHRYEIGRILSSKYREQSEREMMRAAEKYMRQLIEERFLVRAVTPEELRYLTRTAAYIIFGFVIDQQSSSDPDIRNFSKYLIRFTIAQIPKNV